MKKIYIWKVIRKIQGFWICHLFSCLTILKWRNSSKCIYGLLWIQIWNLNLQFFCNAFLLNGINNTSVPSTFHFNTLSCACAFTCILIVTFLHLYDLGRRWARAGDHPRSRRHPVWTIPARQANPIDHVYKIPVPSHSRLCMLRMIHDTFFRIVEPNPLHDLSFCHRSKQTTILAYLGVECWSCGPCNCYCLLHA